MLLAAVDIETLNVAIWVQHVILRTIFKDFWYLQPTNKPKIQINFSYGHSLDEQHELNIYENVTFNYY